MNKYKLINTKTKEEHLCDKVTIDGFDYYVNFGWINNLALKENIYLYNSTFKEIGKVISIYGGEFSVESLDKCISGWSIKELCQKVIVTTNQNIDIPKVVDETWEFFKEIDGSCEKDQYEHWLYKSGYNKCKETYPNSDEDMIEFAEWCQKPCLEDLRQPNVVYISSGNFYWYKHKKYTPKELLQLWKEQRPKIVYYE